MFCTDRNTIKYPFIFSMALALVLVFGSAACASTYYSSWKDYSEANNITSYTWNDVMDAMEENLNAAADDYAAGDSSAALYKVSDVKNSYWGTSGMKVEMQQKLTGSSKRAVEADFKNLNHSIQNGDSSDDVATNVDVLIADLRLAANKLDGVEVEVDVIEETETEATALFNEKYYPTWAEYTAAAGMSEAVSKWNDVADAMSEVFRTAKARMADGDTEGAYNCINDGYYGYYETTGYERNTMGYISGARKSEVELQFSMAKTAAKDGDNDEFIKQTDILRTMIRTDANKLDGVDENGEATGTRSAGMATFIACFSILLREGIEAILVVGAIIAYMIKTAGSVSEEEKKKRVSPVYAGAVLGILLSFVSAWLLNQLKLANSASQEVIEGVTALIAVVVLFWVSNWMVSKSETEAWDAYIKSKVGEAQEKGSSFALAFTAFLAVYREGAEVILFYQPLLSGDNMNMVWAGFIVGAICLVFIYIAITYMSVRLPLKPFFMAMSILMAVMSIAFLGSGIKELIEGDVIPMTSPPWVAWIPSNSLLELLGIYPCVQTIVPQIILTIITIATFVYWIRRNNQLKKQAASA